MKFGRMSVLGVFSSLLSGAAVFVVFRIGFELVGATLLGSWVLVQSAFILARLPEAGIGINLTRQVKVESGDGPADLRPYVFAGLLLCVFPILVIGLLILEPTAWLLSAYFQTGLDLPALRLLSLLSLATAISGSAAAVALSVLEGRGKLGQRYHATIVSNVVLVASAYPLVSAFGVVGIGLTYLAQSAALCVVSLFFLRQEKVDASSAEGPDAVSIAKRLWRENVMASGMALTRMTFEPWTKFLVAATGGLAAVAYLDLALKVTGQIRVAVQSATQPLLWFGARGPDSDLAAARSGFERAHNLVTKSNLFLISLQMVAAGLVSYVGLGFISGQFILFFLILAVGNAINSMGVVGYYYDVSGGQLRRILDIHVRMMILNLVLGSGGALLFGATGAVAAYGLSFAYGGIALGASWMAASGQRWSEDLRKEGGALAQAVGAVALASLLVYGPLAGIRDWATAAISALASGVLFAIFVQRHWRAYR